MGYRDIALRVMTETLLRCRAEGEGVEETAKAIDAAYPFGPRSHWPYKAWLAERRAFFAAHGLPRNGDHHSQAARRNDLVSLMMAVSSDANRASVGS